MSLDNLNNNIYPLSLDGLTTINADSIIINGNNLDPASYVPYTGALSAVNLGNNKITTVYIPSNPEDLVNKFYTDGKFLTLVDASNNYLKKVDAASTYATQSSLSNYLLISTAVATYATLNDLNLYLLSSTAASTYATQASLPSYNFTGTPTITSAPGAADDSDKIPTTHWVNYAMSLIYLPIATANSDYLKIIDAASTYATITNLNLKAPLANPTFTGLVTLPSTVQFSTNPSPGSGTLLAIDGTGNIITTISSLNQTATSTSATYYIPFVSSSSSGAFIPLVYPTLMCNPNSGSITATRLTASTQMETYSMKITNVPNGTLDSLLGVDNVGNVIKGYLTQTASTTNADYSIIFTQYSGTGSFIPLNESTLTYNPSTKNLKTSKLQITGVIAGTQQYLLAIDSVGNVIRGTAISTPLQQVRTLVNADYYIPFVASFTNGDFLPLIENRVKLNPATGTISMFNLILTGNANLASLTFNTLPTTGSPASYLAINSGGVVIRTSAAGGDAYLANNQTFTGSNTFDNPIICNTLNPKASNGLVIDGNGNGIVLFRSLGVTKARVDANGFDASVISNTTLYTRDITAPLATLTLIGDVNAALYSSGINYYGCNTSHQFSINSVDTMTIRNKGVTIPFSTTSHPDLSLYELVVGDNAAVVNKSAKILIRGQSTTTGFAPGIDFTAWSSHTTPQASIEVTDDNNWGGIYRFRAKANGAGSAGALTNVLSLGVAGWLFHSTPAQNVTQNINYVYRSVSTVDTMQICQDEEFFFYYSGDWSVGRYLGTFQKIYRGSKVRINCTATQYSMSVGTILTQIALRDQTSGNWSYATQGTFFNYTGGHFCTPNVDTLYYLPAATYEVWVNGNGVTDANDVLRLHISISP